MKKVDVIGVPMKYGCFLDGADMAFESTRDIYEKKFDNIKEIDNHVKDSSEYKEGSKLKYESAVKEITNRLYNEVSKSLSNGNFPLTIGGDHSTAIGSVSASLEHYKGDVSVIWFDAHTDIHTAHCNQVLPYAPYPNWSKAGYFPDIPESTSISGTVHDILPPSVLPGSGNIRL